MFAATTATFFFLDVTSQFGICKSLTFALDALASTLSCCSSMQPSAHGNIMSFSLKMYAAADFNEQLFE